MQFFFPFNYFASRNVINNAMLQKEIHLMLIYGNINAASPQYPNYETHIISCMSSICINTAAHLCPAEQTCCWIVMRTRCISCCHDCWYKSVSEMWHHRMPISAVSSRTQTFSSCWIICDIISINPFAKLSYRSGRCSQLSGYLNIGHNGLQHANGTLT